LRRRRRRSFRTLLLGGLVLANEVIPHETDASPLILFELASDAAKHPRLLLVLEHWLAVVKQHGLVGCQVSGLGVLALEGAS